MSAWRAPSTALRAVPLPRALQAQGRKRPPDAPILTREAGEGDHAKRGGGGALRRWIAVGLGATTSRITLRKRRAASVRRGTHEIGGRRSAAA
jgi:hypothetical protein